MKNLHQVYRDMTPEQMMAWGIAEAEVRIADLSVRTDEGLIAAQANAEMRRKAIGATRGQAANMVIEATRAIRRAKAQGESA